MKNKYSNIKTVVDGIVFDSKREANYYGILKLMKRDGQIKHIELQPEFKYKMICVHIDDITAPTFVKNYKYIADFKVTYGDGTIAIIDVKGVKTQEYKRKKKIVEKIYGIKIIEK